MELLDASLEFREEDLVLIIRMCVRAVLEFEEHHKERVTLLLEVLRAVFYDQRIAQTHAFSEKTHH